MNDREDDQDRRAHPRLSVDLPARVRGSDEPSVEARAVDLSEGGIRIEGADFPPQAQVTVEIELAELGWQEIPAEVVRAEPGEGEMAARFAAAATAGGRKALRDFIERHIGSSARLP